MSLIGALLINAGLSSAILASPSPNCMKWFAEAKIPLGPECVLKCGLSSTGMDSFMCPQTCPELCSQTKNTDTILGRLLYYPGLTAEERKLVRKHPSEALTVFLQKQKAESATLKRFGRDAQNDESDAFRHFLWAGLLAKEIGPELAKQFLDAHEASGRAEDPNRAMDLANNRAGLLSAESLRKSGKLSEDELVKMALEGIANKSLIILESREGNKQ